MIIITSLIVFAVSALILNGVNSALNETASHNRQQPITKPSDSLKRAYINAYFAHLLFDPETSKLREVEQHAE